MAVEQDLNKTSEQYDVVVTRCKEIFTNKMQDYGSSWRIFRTSSLTDQLFIKA
ncbi:MAG: transcription initiation factor TFIIIB Brf1 subunit/transcription initiation factor TFIIB, partial [Flavobacteriales bacterium]